jgi:glutathione S-transferase
MTASTVAERGDDRSSDPHLKIYWIKAQAPRRVLALVKHLGIEADFFELDMMAGGLKQPSYVALNPNMKAPTLIHRWRCSG